MLIKIPVTQIGEYWELIKTGAVKSDNVPKDQISNYCKHLLMDLYSEEAICVFRCNEAKEIQAVGIFSIKEDKIAEKKFMLLRNLFGIQKVDMIDWKSDFEQLSRFAKNAGCSYVKAESSNERLWSMMRQVGFAERRRVYTLNLERS